MNSANCNQITWMFLMVVLGVFGYAEEALFCAAIVTVCHIAGVIIDRLDAIIKRIDKS